MAHHVLKATCKTVHLGGFSSALQPVLEISSGDWIDFETYTGYYFCDRAPQAFLTPELLEIYHNLPVEQKVGPGPHLLTGPVYIRDAKPGDVLEIHLESIVPRLPIGFNAIQPGRGALPDHVTETHLQFIPLNLLKKTAEVPQKSGIQVPLQPFFGILGVATAETSRSSIPPGPYGGNMDNRELQAGSRVFLPVFLPGGLFSLGDGHSAQGDGEVDLTAIETSMNGTVQIWLRKDLQLSMPMAETPTDFITMGFAETLDTAFQLALKNMIQFLESSIGLSTTDAYVLCSVAVNFRITQVVNSPNKGVHGMLPKAILPNVPLI